MVSQHGSREIRFQGKFQGSVLCTAQYGTANYHRVCYCGEEFGGGNTLLTPAGFGFGGKNSRETSQRDARRWDSGERESFISSGIGM
jgi:hypothetical protein